MNLQWLNRKQLHTLVLSRKDHGYFHLILRENDLKSFDY